MWWLVPAVFSIFGGIEEYRAGKDMERLAKQQERLSEQNALLQKQELQEQVRRQEEEDKRVRSRTLARAAASGARIGDGSIASYMSYMEDEQERQLDWTRKAGASRIRLELAGAKSRAAASRMEAKAQQRGAIYGTIGSVWGFGQQGGWFTQRKDVE